MTSLISVCDAYTSGSGALADVREWLALHQWELEGPLEDLADALDVAIVHLDDGYLDEIQFRQRIEAEVEKALSLSIETFVGSSKLETSFNSDTMDETILFNIIDVGETNATLRLSGVLV